MTTENSETKLESAINIAPEAVSSEEPTKADSKPTGRKRGRPPKSTTSKPAKTATKSKEDTADFAKQIKGIHQFAAVASGFPEMAIDDSEAQMLAKSLDAVAKEYGIELDGKAGAALQLFGAASMIYVPRVFSAKARIQKQKEEHTQNDDTQNNGG